MSRSLDTRLDTMVCCSWSGNIAASVVTSCLLHPSNSQASVKEAPLRHSASEAAKTCPTSSEGRLSPDPSDGEARRKSTAASTFPSVCCRVSSSKGYEMHGNIEERNAMGLEE